MFQFYASFLVCAGNLFHCCLRCVQSLSVFVFSLFAVSSNWRWFLNLQYTKLSGPSHNYSTVCQTRHPSQHEFHVIQKDCPHIFFDRQHVNPQMMIPRFWHTPVQLHTACREISLTLRRLVIIFIASESGAEKEREIESEWDGQMETEKRGARSIATVSKGAGISR